MDILKTNWKEFESRSVKPVWNLFSRHYLTVGLEYGDFANIAFTILNKELCNYNADKSGVYTYSVRVLKRRMADYIRNNYNTDKTRANFCAQSLNVPASEDSDMTIEDSLIDNRSVYKAENNIGKIKRFFKTLSNKQKEILFLTTIGLNVDEVQDVMELTPEEYLREMQKIKSPRRISKLKNEVI